MNGRAQLLAQRLLDGGRCDTIELGYELDNWHLGAIATGAVAAESLRAVADALGAQLLCLPRGEGTVWGWLGRPRPLSAPELKRVLEPIAHADVSLAIGEPGKGAEGWRLTHLQAQEALRVALRSRRRFTSYADVALLASVLYDEVLARSLVEIYISPLGERQNGGAVLCQTLRAYFAAERNASSAASALGVTRHTVKNRLRTIEKKLGHKLHTHQAELEVALRVEELTGSPSAR